MEIKDGVAMQGLQIEMRKVLKAADTLWKRYGHELVITSALDGTHSAGSYHYFGYALDFRSRYFSKEVKTRVTELLQEALGAKYTVINESTHIHVQYNYGR